MTDLEMQFQGADFDETEETEGQSLSPDMAERFERIDGAFRMLGGEIGKIAQAVEVLRIAVSRDSPDRESDPLSEKEGGSFQQFGLVIEMVREAAERTPRETKAAAVAALAPEVQRLAETIDMRLQGLGNAVRAIDQSRISIEQHVLEIRRKHETNLVIRENWALIALVGGGALSVINLLTLAALWFSRG